MDRIRNLPTKKTGGFWAWFKGAENSLFVVVGALRVFATIFVWTFTLYCVKYNGANFIIKMCVNLHMNSNIYNEFPAPLQNLIANCYFGAFYL